MANNTFEAIGKTARVDRKTGIIHDVAVITQGDTKNFDDETDYQIAIDETTVDGVVECAAKFENGVKIKSGHKAGALDIIARLTNVRKVDGQARGDLHVFATHDQASHLFTLAETVPDTFGVSCKFDGPNQTDEANKRVLARCTELRSVDLAADPAANPSGLFEKDDREGEWCSVRGQSVFREMTDDESDAAEMAEKENGEAEKSAKADNGPRATNHAFKASAYAIAATGHANKIGTPDAHKKAVAAHKSAASAHDHAHGTKSVLDMDERNSAYAHRDLAQSHIYTAGDHEKAASGVTHYFEVKLTVDNVPRETDSGNRDMSANNANKKTELEAAKVTELEAANNKISEFETKLTSITTELNTVKTQAAADKAAGEKAITDLKATHATELEAKEKDVEKRASLKAAEATGTAGKSAVAAGNPEGARTNELSPKSRTELARKERKGSTGAAWAKTLPARITELAAK